MRALSRALGALGYSFVHRAVSALLLLAPITVACGAASSSGFDSSGGNSNGNGSGSSSNNGASSNGGSSGTFGSGSPSNDNGTSTSGQDLSTCADAASSHAYIGCDYWPTTVANDVWSIFDFAVVVSNPQSTAATVTVSGPNGVNQQVTVAPGQLEKIYLPWNTTLKGGDWDTCTDPLNFQASVTSVGGAYHLVSSIPVTVYQFDALEYSAQGGQAGKDWSSCPGTKDCSGNGGPIGCYSYSNDASLLLPSTAMTGNYRLMGITSQKTSYAAQGSYFAVTGTQDGTNVSVTLSQTAKVGAGGIIKAGGPGDILQFMLNAGDVAEIAGTGASSTEDLSGSLLKADKPVQVIGGHPCIRIPETDDNATCDHLEETVTPAETLGQHYVVTVPTGPLGAPVLHLVRFYGNVDGTTLTYRPSAPAGCPTTLSAGAVVECAAVTKDFEVTGNHEFGVGSFQESADVVDPNGGENQKGDPAMSFAVAVEQYRSSYVFLAPSDYDVNYVDATVAPGTTLTLDGAPVNIAPVSISTNYSVVRIPLQVGSANGAHVITGSSGFGIQVTGYGAYTAYYYPGGLNLLPIAPAPVK